MLDNIRCPSCNQDCVEVQSDPNVIHHYCPDCQPNYDVSPPGVLEKIGVVVVLLFAIPIGWAYLQLRKVL